MRTRIDDAPRGWFLDYHYAAVAADVERGHRVRRPKGGDGWVTHNAEFDAAWFRSNNYVVPVMFDAAQVTERAVDYGGGLSRIDIDHESAVAVKPGDQPGWPLAALLYVCAFLLAVAIVAFVLEVIA